MGGMEKQSNRAASVSEVTALLRSHRIRPTRQRVRIGASLFACDQHVTAADLWRQLRYSAAPVARATVYNTLELFASKGLIRELDMGAGGRIYDTNLEPHYHMHYLDSGRIEDLDPGQVTVHVADQALEQAQLVGVDVTVRVNG